MSLPAKNSPKERDGALLVAVAAGDRRALEELYLSYHRRLARFLSRFTPRYENVEEIINDTFMVVWQSAKDFRHASQVSTWIIGIAYRTALKSFRRQKNHTVARSLEDYPEQTVDPTFDAEVSDWLQHGLSRLPIEQRLTLGTRLSHGPLSGGDCRDHRLPGWHGEGAHVSRAGEIAPVSAHLERRSVRGLSARIG